MKRGLRRRNMFARVWWKAGLGAALVLLTACREGEAASTPEERAREVVEMLVASKYADVEKTFTPQMRESMPMGMLMSNMAPELQRVGKFEQTGKASAQK